KDAAAAVLEAASGNLLDLSAPVSPEEGTQNYMNNSLARNGGENEILFGRYLPTPNRKTVDDTDYTMALTVITTGQGTPQYNCWWMIMRCWTVRNLIGTIPHMPMPLMKIGTRDLRVRSSMMALRGKSAPQPTCRGIL